MQVGDIQAILRDTSHNGFPVVRDSSAGQICLGLISRAHLLALLQRLIDAYHQHSPGGTANGAEQSTQRQAPLIMRQVRCLSKQQLLHCWPPGC